jgi:hypothetical protein
MIRQSAITEIARVSRRIRASIRIMIASLPKDHAYTGRGRVGYASLLQHEPCDGRFSTSDNMGLHDGMNVANEELSTSSVLETSSHGGGMDSGRPALSLPRFRSSLGCSCLLVRGSSTKKLELLANFCSVRQASPQRPCLKMCAQFRSNRTCSRRRSILKNQLLQ